MKSEIVEFLEHSNFIENEIRSMALDDAVKAWKFAYQYRNNITVRYIYAIHRHLMKRIRPDIAGNLRTCDIWIGGKRKKYKGKTDLIDRLYSLVDIITANISFTDDTDNVESKEKLAKNAHILFEQIHPFEDGNGRVGRILYNIHRLNLGLPIHIIHEGTEQLEYYKWFSSK